MTAVIQAHRPHPLNKEHVTAALYIELVDGTHAVVGDRITFSILNYQGNESSRGTTTGTLVELWCEDHPNVPGLRYYAEVEIGPGVYQRCWVLRDKPERAAGLAGSLPGITPDGAMF